MTKTQLLNQYAQDSQQRMRFASALDKAQQATQRQIPTATGFFTPEEQVAFAQMLPQFAPTPHRFFGGYPQAERKLCYFPAPWEEGEDLPQSHGPIAVISAQFRGELTHRDILGSLMALGLTRGKFGDILLEEGACQVILLEETAPLVLSQWTTAGRFPVTLQETPLDQLVVPEQQVKPIFSTLSTLRLDSLVATGFSLSRSRASTLIAGGKVTLNHALCQKPDKAVLEGDVLVCRGLGKCVLTKVGGQSRKGRIMVEMERYL